jgi:hypothetical protein
VLPIALATSLLIGFILAPAARTRILWDSTGLNGFPIRFDAVRHSTGHYWPGTKVNDSKPEKVADPFQAVVRPDIVE